MARQIHTEYPQKLNIWAEILGNHLIGPFFMEATLKGERYFNLFNSQVMQSIDNPIQ